ncbi:MAG: MFS transporter [Opitutales bacterium]
MMDELSARQNVRRFILFRVAFSARFYYPIYALLFLDLGMSLAQFGILNALWAFTIVLCELPSGALADTIGRRKLVRFAALCMMLEMCLLLLTPVGGGTFAFVLLAMNRILSGLAEAAASGADEALCYDSLQQAGVASEWSAVLVRVQQATSIAFFFALMLGAAAYDPSWLQPLCAYFGYKLTVDASAFVKLPVFLTLLSSLVALCMAYRMQESSRHSAAQSHWAHFRRTRLQALLAGRWIMRSSLVFAVILSAMIFDSVIRQFLTLASQYWEVIGLPVASFGLIGSSMALLGLAVPYVARRLVMAYSPQVNFCFTSFLILLGLVGLAMVLPFWGILPAIFLYFSMQMTAYFTSHYLNQAAPSRMRATLLSFRSLATNVAYGVVACLYALLIWQLKNAQQPLECKVASARMQQQAVFVEALNWFAPYFLLSVLVICVLQKWHVKYMHR